MSTKHAMAAAKFLANAKQAAWHENTLWNVRMKRDKVRLPEWEALRQYAHDLKRYCVTHLESLLLEFEKKATANGAIVHWAKDAEEYRSIILEILQKHQVKKFVKSKSMLSEECELDPFLLSNGIDVIESDLGERILQLMKLPPSHIVLPAIHIKREQVAELFHDKMGSDEKNSDPTYLTHIARLNLRQEFIHADAAMTGANFAIAETGEVVVCTNEGNADMGMACQKLNISAFGLEKVIPNREALATFTRLLARSATGQPITSYTSHYRSPHSNGEYHIIIVDNGRSEIIANEEHKHVLNCLRCGACMNTCPVYRRSGGYSYTYFIPGPIGVNLGMLKNPIRYVDNVSACSLCLSCSNVCPVKIDLGEQIYRWRQNLDAFGVANKEKKQISAAMEFLMDRPALFNQSLKMAPIANKLPRPFLYNSILNRHIGWGIGREYPKFAKQTFNQWWKSEILRGKK